ncbi:MAG: hypothetical protein NVS2B12_08510 [Ktedonobacteraceae bacterium]
MAIAILALEKDLFFSVKIRDTLLHYDMDVTTVRNLASLERGLAATDETKPEMVIINIATKGVDWEAAIRAARAHELPVLAFGSHMDLDARARAIQAGAQKVVANSKFVKDMPGLIQRVLASSTADVSVERADDDDMDAEEEE